MRLRVLGFVGAALLVASALAAAVHCAIDQAPATTLLLPYFELDLASPSATRRSLRWPTRPATSFPVACTP